MGYLKVGSRVRYTAEHLLTLGRFLSPPLLDGMRKRRGEVVSVVAFDGKGLIRVRWDGQGDREVTVLAAFLELEG